MEEYKGILDTGIYHFVCCPYKKYAVSTSRLSEENEEKCLKIYHSLKQISPGLLDGENIVKKIEEIQKNQEFNLNIKQKKGHYSIDFQMQGLNIELAHFEAVDLTK